MGGTGKTPLCQEIFRYFDRKGFKTSILLRGYKSKNGRSDEAAIYQSEFGNDAVFVQPDRENSLRKAEEKSFKVAILDDAFQHRKVGRDLDIVVIDVTRNPLGDHLFPMGFLREPLSSLRRAHIIILNRIEMVSEQQLQKYVDELQPYIKRKMVFKSQMKITDFVVHGELEDLMERNYFLTTGIGHPKNFEFAVQKYGLNLVGKKYYEDHHHYTEREFEFLVKEAKKRNAEAIVTTEKDFVKFSKIKFPVVVARVVPVINETGGRSLEKYLIDYIQKCQ